MYYLYFLKIKEIDFFKYESFYNALRDIKNIYSNERNIVMYFNDKNYIGFDFRDIVGNSIEEIGNFWRSKSLEKELCEITKENSKIIFIEKEIKMKLEL